MYAMLYNNVVWVKVYYMMHNNATRGVRGVLYDVNDGEVVNGVYYHL